MLHILLMILKIIGIVLAVIIGILLIAILCVLLVPVRYCVLADGKLGEKEPFRLEVKVTWLVHFVGAAFTYSKGACLKLRILCFTMFDSSKRKEGGAKKGKRKKGKKGKGVKEAREEDDGATGGEAGLEGDEAESVQRGNVKAESTKAKSIGIEGAETENSKIGSAKIEGSRIESAEAESGKNDTKDGDGQYEGAKTVTPATGKDGFGEGSGEREDDNEREVDSKTGLIGKIKAFFQTIFHFFRKLLEAAKNIEYTIQELCGKIRSVMENIRYYTDILQGESFQKVFRKAKKQLFWIVRRLKPKKCRINLRVGMEDPSGTGQIMAVYGMLYPFIGNYVFLQADFEEKVMEGDLYIRGKITAIIFLIAAIKLLADKNIWKLIKLLKKEDV